MAFENQIRTLQQFADELVNELKLKAPKNTGALENSIDYTLNENGLSFEMLDYGVFINDGVNGTEINRGSIYSFNNKRPPISSISSFAESIGANPYALQNSIYRNGIKPTFFIDETITEDKFNNLADKLAESFWDDFYNQNK